jgi:ankyrin repeat protein
MAARYLATFAFGISVLFGQDAGNVDFRRDIQPLFQEHCIGCHGPTQQMAGLRLDRRSSAMAIRGGTIIGPGNAAGSRLYLKLIGTRYGSQMPPTGALSSDKIKLVKDWIDQGAEWPDDASGDKPPQPADPNAQRMMDSLRAGDARAFDKAVRDNANSTKLKGSGGSTPLMYAVLYGTVASIKQLLDRGADPNAANDAGATALMWALDDIEKARLLLDRGADPNAISNDNRSPLMIALGNPASAPVVKLLLANGAKTDAKVATGRTLFRGVGGDPDVLRALVEHGVDRKLLAGGLGTAVESGCTTCVDLLIDVAPKPALGPVLLSAALTDDAGTLKLLLDRGADPKFAAPGLGFTPLLFAAASEHPRPEHIRLLAERGADVNAKTADGFTALDLALRQGHSSVIELLRNFGATESEAPQRTRPEPFPAPSARAAVIRSIPLLQRSDVTFIKKSGCVSCHNNNLTALTLVAARSKGIAVDERVARSQVKSIASYIEANRERYLQGVPIAGGPETAAYILVGLAAEGHPPDLATDAMARWLKTQQQPNGGWSVFKGRPPLESSDFQVTAMALRALRVYAPKPHREQYTKATQFATQWLMSSEAKTTEDRAFQLLGLAWAGVKGDAIRKAAAPLLAEQRANGGWAQLSTLPSDAYATGQALVALNDSGAVRPSDASYTRGATFLINTQGADGSWYVGSRSIPFQPFFESDFPHGPDQFISAAATNWAVMALAKTVR